MVVHGHSRKSRTLCGNECGNEVTENRNVALTALKVKNIGPGRHADAHGLYLLVKDSGSRSWVLRMQTEGRRRDFGLGSLRDVSLAQARDAAADLRRQLRRGGDPVAECPPSAFNRQAGFVK